MDDHNENIVNKTPEINPVFMTTAADYRRKSIAAK